MPRFGTSWPKMLKVGSSGPIYPRITHLSNACPITRISVMRNRCHTSLKCVMTSSDVILTQTTPAFSLPQNRHSVATSPFSTLFQPPLLLNVSKQSPPLCSPFYPVRLLFFRPRRGVHRPPEKLIGKRASNWDF